MIRARWSLPVSWLCQEQFPLEGDKNTPQLYNPCEAAVPVPRWVLPCGGLTNSGRICGLRIWHGVVNRIRPEGDETWALNGQGSF